MEGKSVITIDGPNGAGKGTLGRALSEELGWPVLDTGLMYRAAAMAVLEAGIDLEDEAACGQATAALEFSIEPPDTLLVDGVPAEHDRLRSPEAGEAASKVSVHRSVRDHLQAVQREFAEGEEVIIDGRDIGTSVVPDAKYKFFLTASPEARARRRLEALAGQAPPMDYETMLEDVERRDARDRNRTHDPLQPAEDALEIDTTDLTVEAVADQALGVIKKAVR